jgi:release factor glutamine methyltransferase
VTVTEAIRRGAARLRAAGIENARLEARLLLAHALSADVAALLREPERNIDTGQLEALLARREAREPLAFILGRREFWSLPFAVSPATLIPRPDSETLVEAALGAVPPGMPALVLDLGTGTGCLLLAVLHERPAAFGVGVDISPHAAALAARNARDLGLARRSAFLCGDWATALDGRFDLVLANPPYVESAAIAGLMPDVACHEPRSALDGGPDGFDAYRAILPHLPRLLTPGGTAILELGAGQAEIACRMAAAYALGAESRVDLATITRAIVLRQART